jgi:hypothetical protein
MDKYTEYFGEPTCKDRKNWTYACPLCVKEGGDESCDNLKIKIDGGLMTCFKSPAHTKELRKNYKHLRPVIKIKAEAPVIDFQEDKIKENTKYLTKCRKNLNDDYNTLISHRGLKVSTLQELKVGIDLEKQAWVFPIFHHPTNKLIGFEYRDINMYPRKEGGQIWRSEGSFSCLAQINSKPAGYDSIIIMEGFMDAYCAYQYMKENLKIRSYWILTPTCGVGMIAKHINEIKTKCGFDLFIDNYKAGDDARIEIQKASKWCYFDLRVPEKYSDFGEYYIAELIKGK